MENKTSLKELKIRLLKEPTKGRRIHREIAKMFITKRKEEKAKE